MRESIRVEALARRHDRAGFECPTGGLEDYLRDRASQDVKRRAAAVFVAIYPSAPETILGYYALSSFSLKLTDIPAQQQRGLARYPDVGVTLLGRLAVGVAHRGQHIGEFLLMDALRCVVSSSSTIATVALVVDALDGSETFYTRYGFIHLGGQRYWLPLDTARSLVQEQSAPILADEES